MDRKCEQMEVSSPTKFAHPRNLLAYPFEDGVLQGAVPQSLNHFIKCVLEDREPVVTLASSLRVTRILDAIQRSTESGAAIRL
jgi:predicted dehydrogenase